jgi:hypothetical protein
MDDKTKKGLRHGELLRASVTPALAALIRDAAADGADPVGVDDILARIEPRRLSKASLKITRGRDEQAALAEERAGL